MAQEAANSVEESVKPAARRVVRRVKAAAAEKPAARKTTARKTAAGRKPAATRKAKPANPLKKASETAKEVAYVQLGICGKVYDEVNTRVSKARKQAPKQWSELVKRGERVQQDLDKVQKDLTKDLRKRVNKLEIPAPIETRVTNFTKAVKKLTARVNKAA
ncbi:MAG: hypothetical protein KBG29_05405 [Pseudomonadales bacterium]|jgi:hypothetical protein|nr:hypothetical protein [Pseudomonadales bacterium]MBP9033311.1 hypothetical protein [Pseudomonadales bacterium]